MIAWACLGGGKMAGALLRGAVAAGAWQPEQLAVAEPSETLRRQWAQEGYQAVSSAAELPPAAAVLVCVKPQDLPAAARELSAGRDLSATPATSIVAGASVATLARLLGTCRIVRAMPNTPALLRTGCTFAFAGDADTADREQAAQLFSACGKLFWVEREELIDAATALSGSGPAYAYLLMEAMAEAGEQLGLERSVAAEAAAQTLAGAARMVQELGQGPAELRAAVTSKAGTTEAALEVLAQRGFTAAVGAAMAKASLRAAELAAAAEKESSA